jgi:hypothetical protein
LVQLQEPETAIKDVLRAGEPGLCQHGRENTGARRLAGLHPLGQCSVQNALAIAGGVTVRDAEGGQHLLGHKPDQLACSRRGAEDPDRRGTMPAPVERAGERDAARYVQPQRDRQQHIPPADTPEAIAYREDRPQHGDAGMDRAAGIERVVEIQRMTHAGIQQGCLWRRQAEPAQQDAAFRQAAPAGDHRKELVDPRGAAAAEHAAKGVENIAAGGCDGARRQIRVAGAANVLG